MIETTYTAALEALLAGGTVIPHMPEGHSPIRPICPLRLEWQPPIERLGMKRGRPWLAELQPDAGVWRKVARTITDCEKAGPWLVLWDTGEVPADERWCRRAGESNSAFLARLGK